MINQDVDPDPDGFAGLVQRLQETPNILASLVEEFRVLSASPALADGLTGQTIPTTGPPANAGGSDKALRWRNADGEFSALETICHLRDIEAEGYAIRINRILAEPNHLLADVDGAGSPLSATITIKIRMWRCVFLRSYAQRTWRSSGELMRKSLSEQGRLKV